MPVINQRIPDFKLQAFDPEGGVFKSISSEDLRGKWSVLFFYPADFTFVCPTELADLQDHLKELREMGAVAISVSTDTHFTHKAWHDHGSDAIKKIRFPMLADPAGVLSRAMGVYIEEEGVATRATFVIDPELKLKAMEIHDNGIGRNAEELVRRVAAAKFVADNPGEVCPAKWKEGDDTLKPSLDLVGKI